MLGQVVATLDDAYEIEAQDKVTVQKEGVRVELWAAADGKGVVALRSPGSAPVHSAADAGSEVVGTLVWEDGFCPVCLPCLGYEAGWFKVDLDGREGYLPETLATWDFADRN